MPDATPLTSPATTTTSTGFLRSAKPATTTATPSNGHAFNALKPRVPWAVPR